MSLWDRIAADATDVLLNDTDELTCTAIQLTTGQQFTGFFHHTDSDRDQKFGVANCLKGSLWIPTRARPKQQEQWSITLPDGAVKEMTVMSFGVSSGGLQELKMEELDVTRFGSTTFGGNR